MKIIEIRQKIDILEQQNLRASVKIIGIPKIKNKNCLNIVEGIEKKMSIDIPII